MDSINGASTSDDAQCHDRLADEDTQAVDCRRGVGADAAERAAAKVPRSLASMSRRRSMPHSNIGGLENVHLAQADVFCAAVSRQYVRSAYSIGVCITRLTAGGLCPLARALTPGGKLAVYAHARYGPSHRVSDAIRLVTTRLPLRVTRVLSSVAVPLTPLMRPGCGTVAQRGAADLDGAAVALAMA
jgi:hypothetical protein